MKRMKAMILGAALLLGGSFVISCSSVYTVASPLVIPAKDTKLTYVTANRNSKILDSSGVALAASTSTSIDVGALAKANFIKPEKVTKVTVAYTIKDDDWWIQADGFSYQIGSQAAVTFWTDPAVVTGKSFNGTYTTGTVSIPYTYSAADSKITFTWVGANKIAYLTFGDAAIYF